MKYEVIPLGADHSSYIIDAYKVGRYYIHVELTAINEYRVRVWDNGSADKKDYDMKQGAFVFDWFCPEPDFSVPLALTYCIFKIQVDDMLRTKNYFRVTDANVLETIGEMYGNNLIRSMFMPVAVMYHHNRTFIDRNNMDQLKKANDLLNPKGINIVMQKPALKTLKEIPGGFVAELQVIPSRANI